jgi:hypothetical protein
VISEKARSIKSSFPHIKLQLNCYLVQYVLQTHISDRNDPIEIYFQAKITDSKVKLNKNKWLT